MMKISIENFKNSFIPIKDNYVLEIKTGKTYVANYLDDTNEVLLLEPENYEKNIEKLSKKATKRLEELFWDFV